MALSGEFLKISSGGDTTSSLATCA